MLIISLKRNDCVMIGDDIKISVAEIRYGKVKIGIAAPTSVPVYRDDHPELLRRGAAEKGGVDRADGEGL